MNKRYHNKSGFTLVEILISALIFTLALGVLSSSLITALHLIEVSRDRTIAISDLRDMMEEIRVTPFVDMLSVFPNSMVDGPGGSSYQSIVGGYSLNNEQIVVTYAGMNSDPLEIMVNLSWLDKQGRAYGVSASTFKTR